MKEPTRQQKRKAERQSEKDKRKAETEEYDYILWDGYDKDGNPIGGMKKVKRK